MLARFAITIVDKEDDLAEGLRHLMSSLDARALVAIDLEWRPDFVKNKRGSSVALIQLASRSCCLFIRLCCFRDKRPPVLLNFLRDPSIHLVGFDWNNADEGKLRYTMGIGRERFGNFHDLKVFGQSHGYYDLGLARLTGFVLGWDFKKRKKVTMSNWEAAELMPQQVKYAALDALLCWNIMHVLLTREDPPTAEVCSACGMRMGPSARVPANGLPCPCGKSCISVQSLQMHVTRCNGSDLHCVRFSQCHHCGRVVPLEENRDVSEGPGEVLPQLYSPQAALCK
eukprot:jgi/Botrbrau1/21053/Bobra.0144s0053.2